MFPPLWSVSTVSSDDSKVYYHEGEGQCVKRAIACALAVEAGLSSGLQEDCDRRHPERQAQAPLHKSSPVPGKRGRRVSLL